MLLLFFPIPSDRCHCNLFNYFLMSTLVNWGATFMTVVIRRGRPSAPARSLQAPRRCRRGIPCRFRAHTRGRRWRAPSARSAQRAGSSLPALCSDWMISNTCSTRIGARPMEGSSSIMQLRRAHQRAAHGEHLLLAAGERSGDLTARVPSGAGTARTPFRAAGSTVAVGAGDTRPFQGFPPRSSARTRAVPPGTSARPSLTIRWGALCAMLSP